ncbi:MAG: HpcH/HpaI aldolase family protein [bacterium]
MTKLNSPKQQILSGAKLAGCWISMFSNIAAEIMSDAGYDIAMIDLEHAPGSLIDAITMMQAVEARGCYPMIRSSSKNIVDIKRILDIGPAGIMIPDVRSAKEAEEVIKHCRYAPQGDRGAAPGYMRAMGYGGFNGRARNGADYSAFMEQDFLIILQVESAEAVDQISEIAKVDGIDMLFIGPADLSASLGKLGDFSSEQFKQAISTIEEEALNAGISLGTIPFADWDAARLYRSGHQLVISGADAMLLAAAAKEDLLALKSSGTP